MRAADFVGLHSSFTGFGCKKGEAGLQVGLIAQILLNLFNNLIVDSLKIGLGDAGVVGVHHQIGPDGTNEQLIVLPIEEGINHFCLASNFVEDRVKANFLFVH